METSVRLPTWLRDPRYTGEDRCVPCTVVNVVIAGVLAAAVATQSVGLGGVVLAVALVTIAVRGYLVPGTPTLTKRYLPDRVLALFDKGPARPGAEPTATTTDTATTFDPAAALLDSGVLVDDPAVDDLVLDDSFRARWTGRARELADRDRDADGAALATFLDVDPESVATVDRGYAYVASIDGEPVGQWESRPAFLMDIAASDVLSGYWTDWDALATAHQSELLGNLRLFVETCPTCDGTVTLDTTVVESCCRQYDVLAATCDDCGARLFEADVDPAALERVGA